MTKYHRVYYLHTMETYPSQFWRLKSQIKGSGKGPLPIVDSWFLLSSHSEIWITCSQASSYKATSSWSDYFHKTLSFSIPTLELEFQHMNLGGDIQFITKSLFFNNSFADIVRLFLTSLQFFMKPWIRVNRFHCY
jgi:hypothetical protein